jgi:hypothetical protein
MNIIHHSLTDWDWQHGDTGRSLSDLFFVSAPTSLEMTAGPERFLSNILCRIPATLCIPQGEVRTWVRGPHPSFTPCLFRNQAPLGTSDHENCYFIGVAYGISYLYRRVDGSSYYPDTSVCYTAANVWLHYRTFWYNGLTPGEVPALCVDIYLEVDGEWVKQGETLYDTVNAFKDSEINRCGIRANVSSDTSVYHDDTEIWGPV